MRLHTVIFCLGLVLMLITMRSVEVRKEDDLLKLVAYTVDTDEHSSIEEVVNATFQPGQPDFWSPHPTNTRWLKLTVSPLSSGEPIVIRVANRLMRSLELYQFSAEGWKVMASGINTPMVDRFTSSSQFGFPVSSSKTSDQTYYLKVTAATRTFLDIDAITLTLDSALSLQKNLIRGFVVTITLFFLIVSIIQFYFDKKNVIFIYFSFCQLAALLAAAVDTSFFHLISVSADTEANLFLYGSIARLVLAQILAARIMYSFEPPTFFKVVFSVFFLLWLITALRLQENNALVSAIFIYALYFPLTIAQLLALKYCKSITPIEKKLTFHFFFGVFLLQCSFVAFWLSNASTFVAYQTSMSLGMQCVIGLGYFVFIYQQRRAETHRALQVQQELLETQRSETTQKMLLQERTLLVDILTHQIKNPLATIRMAADNLIRRPQANPATVSERALKISDSSDEINVILEHCHLINALDNHSVKPAMVDINLKDHFENLTAYTLQRARFNFDIPEDLWVLTDNTYLGIVFTNLLENALKYGDPNQPISIRQIDTDSLNPQKLITIAISNKIGIHGAPSHRNLAERFYRASISNGTFGMGLGLYICGAICQLLSIQISFEVIQKDVVFKLTFEKLNNPSLSHKT